MPISVDLAKALDKDCDDKSLKDILDASPAALAGVTDADAAALAQAFTSRRSASPARTVLRCCGGLGGLGGHCQLEQSEGDFRRFASATLGSVSPVYQALPRRELQ